MARPKKHILLFIVLLIYTLHAEEIQDQEYKFEVNPQWYSTDNFAIQGPIGISKKVSEYERYRYYVRPSVAYSIDSKWSARVGIFGAYNSIEDISNTIEIRPYLGVHFFHPYKDKFENMSISTYFRVEDRVRYNVDTWENEQNWRARLRVWGIYDLNPETEENSWHRVILGAELLRTYFNKNQKDIGLDENFDVETRLLLAVERTLKDNQKVRFDLSWIYQVPFDDIHDVKFNTVVFRIKYYPIWGDIFKNRLFHHLDD